MQKNSVIKLIASSVRKLFLYLLKTVQVGIAQCIMLFLIRNNGKYCIDFCHFLQVYCFKENVNERYYLNLRGNKQLNVQSHHHNDRSNGSFVKSKRDFDETVRLMLSGESGITIAYIYTFFQGSIHIYYIFDAR